MDPISQAMNYLNGIAADANMPPIDWNPADSPYFSKIQTAVTGSPAPAPSGPGSPPSGPGSPPSQGGGVFYNMESSMQKPIFAGMNAIELGALGLVAFLVFKKRR